MSAEQKRELPQEGTGLAGESLPEPCSGSPSYSGGGNVLHHVDSTENKGSKKMVQQAFHPSLFINRPRSSSLSSTSRINITTPEILTARNNNPPDWQRAPTLRNPKRKKHSPPSPERIPTNNHFSILAVDVVEDGNTNNSLKKAPYKPPPIILYGIENINKLTELISTVAEKDEFFIKIINKNQLRLISVDIATYKKVITIVRENGLIGHTFNIKDQRCCRLVIKNLHHSTPHSDIIEEIESTGNKVHSEIINVKYGPEKKPTSTFFVNIESGPNNDAAKGITKIGKQIVLIEEPRKRNTLPQCQRCQQYGHSKNYCMRPYRCVKCAQDHKTSDCPKKDRNSPASCALCGGAHPANYKGCEVYKEIMSRRTSQQRPMKMSMNYSSTQNIGQPTATAESHQQNQRFEKTQYTDTSKQTYADIAKTLPTTNSNNLEIILTQQALKLDKLLDQMSTMMNLLTTVINKLIN